MKIRIGKKATCFVVVLLALAVAAMPAAAAADPVAMLQSLQARQVSAEWNPDVEANREQVTQMLAAVKTLAEKELEAISEADQTAMTAYFKTLYQIDGKDMAELDTLFTGEKAAATAEPTPAPAPSAEPQSTPAATAPPTVNLLTTAEPTPAATAQPTAEVSAEPSASPAVSDAVQDTAESAGHIIGVVAGVVLVLVVIAVGTLVILSDRRAVRKAEEERKAAEEKRKAKKEKASQRGKK